MNFNNQIESYLAGSEFDSGLPVPIHDTNMKLVTRLEFIENIAKNKKVIHLGCCDHIGLINQKIANNTWLHNRIVSKAMSCLGIDIDDKAVEFVQQLGIQNIIVGDITSSEKIYEVIEESWDIMIMGEILEHLDNPVSFLKQIRENYAKNIKSIVITVPNAFFVDNFRNAKKGKELINSDHRFYFTPYTLARVVSSAGFKVVDFVYTDEVKRQISLKGFLRFDRFLKWFRLFRIVKKYPSLRRTLVMTIEAR